MFPILFFIIIECWPLYIFFKVTYCITSGQNLWCCSSTRIAKYQFKKCAVNRERRYYLQHQFSHPRVASWTAANCVIRDSAGPLSLFLWSICCWRRPCSRPAINTLPPVCFTCGCLTQRSRNAALRPSGRSGSVAVAALALVTHTPAHYSSPWGDADRGAWAPDLKHIVSQFGGGGARWRKMLFTDGPLKEPTAAKRGSQRAVCAEAIMCGSCLPCGHWSQLKVCGQGSLIFISTYFFKI